ncbi:hypothetical protein Q0O53_13860, partial [Staphylococcus aureus]|nr:hypothetical protein [Staphylococcus aureus]
TQSVTTPVLHHILRTTVLGWHAVALDPAVVRPCTMAAIMVAVVTALFTRPVTLAFASIIVLVMAFALATVAIMVITGLS